MRIPQVLLATFLVVPTSPGFSASPAAPLSSECRAFQASVEPWGGKVESAIGGEVSRILAPVKTALDARRSGETASIAPLGAKLRRLGSDLASLEPPADVARLHRLLLDHVSAAERLVDAIGRSRDDFRKVDNEEALRRLPEARDAYRTLLDYDREMASLLRSRSCGGGDLEALERREIPEIERLLERLAAPASAPRAITRP